MHACATAAGSGYVPILKGKNGEYGALEALSPEDKERMTPLIEIPPIPWDHTNDTPAKTIDQHLSKVDGKLEKSWGSDQLFFIDLRWIGERERISDGAHPLANLFGRVRLHALKAVPVTGLIGLTTIRKPAERSSMRTNVGFAFAC